MLIVNFNNLYHDIILLVNKNKAKFVILIILVIFAIILGIMRGIAILRTAEIIKIDSLNIVLLIKRTRGLFGYFLKSMFGCALLLLTILICSYRFHITFISALILLISTFLSIKNTILLFGVLKLTFLPVGIIYILFFMLKTIFFIFVILHTMNRFFDKYCRLSYIMSDIIHAYVLLLIPIGLLCLLESILMSILSTGVTI